MNLYIPWILRLPVSMGRKLEEVGERYSRNDFIPQESSWPITREENVRPTVNRGESRPEIGSHSYFSLSLSPSSDSLCRPSSSLGSTEPRSSSKRNKLNLAGFQRSWRNSSNRPTRFPSESLSFQLGSRTFRFLLLGKELARSCKWNKFAATLIEEGI